MGTPNSTQTRIIAPSVFRTSYPLVADTYLRAEGGRYGFLDNNGYFNLCVAGSARIDAWSFDAFQVVHDGFQGQTPYPIRSSFASNIHWTECTRDLFESRFATWIPCYTGETLTIANIGDHAELAVIGATTDIVQYVRPSVTTTPLVKIVDVDIINNYALVYAITP